MACLTPFYVKDNQDDEIPVPCGKCPECFARRISGWSFRLMQEGRRSSSAHFVTLTYDTEFVPITPKGYMTLSRPYYDHNQLNKNGKPKYISSHLQLFFKRLRKLQHEQIKYYAVGEYGGTTNRPHHHVILFNSSIANIERSWIDPGTSKSLGAIHYGDVSEASIGYTLKYISKVSRIPMHGNDDRTPEYPMMSKHLGDNYITEKKNHIT